MKQYFICAKAFTSRSNTNSKRCSPHSFVCPGSHLGKGPCSAWHGFEGQQNALQSNQDLCTVPRIFDPTDFATQKSSVQNKSQMH